MCIFHAALVVLLVKVYYEVIIYSALSLSLPVLIHQDLHLTITLSLFLLLAPILSHPSLPLIIVLSSSFQRRTNNRDKNQDRYICSEYIFSAVSLCSGRSVVGSPSVSNETTAEQRLHSHANVFGTSFNILLIIMKRTLDRIRGTYEFRRIISSMCNDEVDVGHLFHSKLLGVVGATQCERGGRDRWVVINGMANIEQNRAAFLRPFLLYAFLLRLLSPPSPFPANNDNHSDCYFLFITLMNGHLHRGQLKLFPVRQSILQILRPVDDKVNTAQRRVHHKSHLSADWDIPLCVGRTEFPHERE